LFGQSAELSGLVRDPSGQAVGKASVELRSQETGARFRGRSNNEGLYRFAGLKPGTYDATVQSEGFRILTRGGIELNVGDRAGLDFALQLRDVSSSITVDAREDGDLNSDDAGVGTVVTRRVVENMPLNGRSFQSLIHITPGILIMPSAQDAPGQFSSSGQRTNSNYFMVDGVSANFGTTASGALGQTAGGTVPALNAMGGTNGLVSVDAMQEFRIQTSSYAPEYGRAPGAQISIVTRSGTNELHGTAYDYLRNDVFDARNWFNTEPQPKPPLRQNDFGGTAGGPIRRNRSFFFASYEGLRLRQPATGSGIFLTAAARAKAPTVFQPIVNAFPIPTGPVNPDGLTAPLTVSHSDPSRFDATSIRVDHASGDRVRLFARYNHSPSTYGARSFAQQEDISANIDTATVGATITVSPSQVNDFRANWSRATGTAEVGVLSVYGAVTPPESAMFPSFTGRRAGLSIISFPFLSGSVSQGVRADNRERQFNLVDTFSMTAGRHQMKFGADFRRIEPTRSSLNYLRAVVVSDYQMLLDGKLRPSLLSNSEPLTARFDSYSIFAQDTWKATDQLTITYGLRWEINTAPVSVTRGKPLYAVAGLFDNRPLGLVEERLWQTALTNFAPRFGAAWRFRRDSVIRVGGGLFYDLGFGKGTNLDGLFPYVRSVIQSNLPAIPFDWNDPVFRPAPFTLELSPSTAVQAVDPSLQAPLTYQWNAAWERRFGEGQSLTATYAGAWGTRLLRLDSVTPRGSILAQGGGMANVTYNAGRSRYDALQLRWQRRMSRGVQALASYSLSRSNDTGSSDVGFGSSGGYTQLFAGSVSELSRPPSAPSDFDARHVASAAASWEIPATRRGGKLLRGWALDGLVRAYSARPLNVLYQRVIGPNGAYNVQPDVVPGQPYWIADANSPEGRVVNPQAFTRPAGFSGNFPRNSLRAFPFSQFDLALRRRFRLSERLQLDARAEYFNVLNHPVFPPPSNLWGVGNSGPTALFGKIPGYTLNRGLGGGGLTGGQALLYAPGGPRSAQFTLKLSF
jgi:hypothetical protein